MDNLDRLFTVIQIVLVGAFSMLFGQLMRLKAKVADTRENMATREDLAVIITSLANTRESYMKREELAEIVKTFKADTDTKLDHISRQLEGTRQKIADNEEKSSEFRHDLRDKLQVTGLRIVLIANKVGLDLPNHDC